MGDEEIVWITGASSGLGESLAREYAARGCQVIASGRDARALARLRVSNDRISILPFDITDEAGLDAVGHRLGQLTARIDRVILNAGRCEYLEFPEPDWTAVRRVMEVNFHGAINCLRLALPLLRASRRGRSHVVAIASLVTAAPFPRAEAYGASKAALQYFCDSLRVDLAADGIAVTVVDPGFIDTPMTRTNDFPMPFLLDADSAARRIAARLDRRPATLRFPRRLALTLALSKIWPGLWRRCVARNRADSAPAGACR